MRLLTVHILSALPTFAAETFKTPQALIKALYAYDIEETAADAPSPTQPSSRAG